MFDLGLYINMPMSAEQHRQESTSDEHPGRVSGLISSAFRRYDFKRYAIMHTVSDIQERNIRLERLVNKYNEEIAELLKDSRRFLSHVDRKLYEEE